MYKLELAPLSNKKDIKKIFKMEDLFYFGQKIAQEYGIEEG